MPLLHVLPSGFTRIRYFGFLANRNRAENVLQARRLIEEHRADGNGNNAAETSFEPTRPLHSATDTDEIELCPECKNGRLFLILRVDYPGRHETWRFDSS